MICPCQNKQEITLLGEYKDSREFHIGSDMLVIYMVDGDVIKLLRIGTHAKLFK